MSTDDNYDLARYRETWLIERREAAVRFGQGAAIAASAALLFVVASFFLGDAGIFLATAYTCYAIIDGPRRMLGGATQWVMVSGKLRTLKRETVAPARLL